MNFLELRKGEVRRSPYLRTSEKTCAPTLGEKRSGRAGGWGVRARPGNGFDCTRERPGGALKGIVFSYVQISGLVVLVYIRNTLRHGTEAKRRAGGHWVRGSDPMIEAGAPSTRELCLYVTRVPVPPGTGMVSQPEPSSFRCRLESH
jgi:hypothetical protein